MKRFALVLLAIVLPVASAFPISKTEAMLMQLQASVQQLQSDVRDMRSAMDERMGMLRQMADQQAATVNKLNAALDAVQRSIQNTVAAQGAKVDSLGGDVRAVHDSLEDLRARIGKLSEQMQQMRTAIETLQAPPPAAVQPAQPATPAPIKPPPPDDLYQSSLLAFSQKDSEAAMHGFTDYLKFYADGDKAGNAQFYIGEVLRQQGNFKDAVDAYDVVLERYPKSTKVPTAHLEKGFVLLQLKQRDAGLKELRDLIRLYPRSDEAKLAKERIASLGASGATKAPKSRRR